MSAIFQSMQATAPVDLLPVALRRRGEALMHQQCWLWGQDIRYPGGNLLLALGFERARPGADGGSTRYRLDDPDGLTVVLWGFGIAYRPPGTLGVFLHRYGFAPLALPDTADLNVHTAAGVPTVEPASPGDRARIRTRAADLARWIAGYEREILRRAGPAHRESAIARWTAACCGPLEVATRWDELATELTLHGARCNA
jgi:hypothetical protein